MFIEKEKNHIVGIYENVLIKDKVTQTISPNAQVICENLHNKKFKRPVVFEIYSDKDEKSNTDIVFKIHRYNIQNQVANFDLVNSGLKESKEQFELTGKLISDNRLGDIIDFDEHFENASLDWRNLFVDSYIK